MMSFAAACFVFLRLALGEGGLEQQVPAKIHSLVEEENWSEAQTLLRDFLAQDSSGTRFGAIMRLASDWDREQQWERSLWVFGQIVAQYPQWPVAGLNLANAYRHAGSYQKSEEIFQNWIARFPNESSLHNDLGLLHQAQHQWDLAETEFREAMRLGDENAPANLTILWRLQGKIDAGRQALTEVLSKQPQSAWARRAYALWRLDRPHS